MLLIIISQRQPDDSYIPAPELSEANLILSSIEFTIDDSEFTAGDSSVNQLELVELYNIVEQVLDQAKEVRAAFCEISKAFDMVWQRFNS